MTTWIKPFIPLPGLSYKPWVWVMAITWIYTLAPGVCAASGDAPPGLALIPGGSFSMGDHHGLQPHALPVREVTVSSFYMGRHPVTYAEWRRVYEWAVEHGYEFDNAGGRGSQTYTRWRASRDWDSANRETSGTVSDAMPVIGINWYDAVKWCNARSEMEGRPVVYYTDLNHTDVYRTGRVDITNASVDWSAPGYRLPTEAEWEKAARGGLEGQHFPWPGDGPSYLKYIDGSKANYHGSGNPFEGGTSPVGSFPPNGYGLYDMAGNVWERIWDWYCDDWYQNPRSTGPDPRGPEAGSPYDARGNIGRVGRGGRWHGPASRRYPPESIEGDNPSIADLRCATRLGRLPQGISGNYGLRIAMTAPE